MNRNAHKCLKVEVKEEEKLNKYIFWSTNLELFFLLTRVYIKSKRTTIFQRKVLDTEV